MGIIRRDDSMLDASNEHENAACYEGYRNTSVNKGERTMSDQNGTVWRGAGSQRHRVSNPAVAPLTKARPARRIQKLSESKRTGGHHLAKVLEAPASDSVSSADEQIRQSELQQHRAQVERTNGFGQMAMTHPVTNVQAKWKRRTRDKRPSLPSARALGGSFPAVPIFIPADPDLPGTLS
jgi:hypothetical protein